MIAHGESHVSLVVALFIFLFLYLTFILNFNSCNKKTGCINDNCNRIVIEVSPIPLEHQIIPLMYKDKPIDWQASLKIIEEGSDLPRKNFPGLTSTQHCCCPPSATGPSIPVSPSKHNWQCQCRGDRFYWL